jgi:short-subunit dehydrogenase
MSAAGALRATAMPRARLQVAGAAVLLTGASRGLGPVIADVFARRGARLALAARNGVELERVAASLRELGAEVITVPTDVAERAQLEHLVARTNEAFGRIDVLVNNAGIEQVCFYESLELDEIAHYIAVNLTAPLSLSRLVLPGMQARGMGHIVNMASVAGFGAAAFGETYGATKAGLLGFTRSLRASLKTLDSPVSASVVCPSFVAEAGMFADLKNAHAIEAPPILGTCTPHAVADAVLRVIERDEPEVFVGRRPLRVMFSGAVMFPRLLEWLSLKLGVNRMFLRAAREHEEKR